jgi:hypothetical protein
MRDMGEFIGLVAVMMLFGIPIVGVVGHYGYAAFKAWLEIGLKRDMVARDYTAQEIVEVLAATRGAKKARSLPNVPVAQPVNQGAYQ